LPLGSQHTCINKGASVDEVNSFIYAKQYFKFIMLLIYIMNDMELHNALTEKPFTVRHKCWNYKIVFGFI